jgi:acyl carrier protein
MDSQEAAELVRAEVRGLLGADAAFADTDSLVDQGLDSLSGVELTLNLESAFGIVFEDEELAFENFATVSDIVALLGAKLGPVPAGDRVDN